MKNIVSCNTLYETTFQNIIYVYSIFEKSNWQKRRKVWIHACPKQQHSFVTAESWSKYFSAAGRRQASGVRGSLRCNGDLLNPACARPSSKVKRRSLSMHKSLQCHTTFVVPFNAFMASVVIACACVCCSSDLPSLNWFQ